jgi:hypothetical protein
MVQNSNSKKAISKYKEQFDVIVVGGGAAGMMAAGRAAERGRRVLLLEKNQNLGEKLKITGGGRCNVTNAEFDTHTMLKNYGDAEQFLYSPFSQFGVKRTFLFFESQKLPLVVQGGKRVFPKSERALDVFCVLEKYVHGGGAVVKTGAGVSRIVRDKKKVTGVFVGGTEYFARAVILATGGTSHPETGSTGDGFGWLGALGHTVQTPTPTIVPIAVREKWVKNLAGVTISPVKITFYVNGKKEFSRKGEVLFTHFGLSGPTILNSAGKVGDMLHSGIVTAALDVYPNMDAKSLEDRILKIFDANKNKDVKNAFKSIAPPGMASEVLSIISCVSREMKVNAVTREQRKMIVGILKALPVTITNLMGFDRAVVADGGVILSEIDTKTMRSKLYDNLYVTGDLLHINRPSGGYSLQLCWTTGYVAGSQA